MQNIINDHYVLTLCDSIPDGQITVIFSIQKLVFVDNDKPLHAYDNQTSQAARLTYENYVKEEQA